LLTPGKVHFQSATKLTKMPNAFKWNNQRRSTIASEALQPKTK